MAVKWRWNKDKLHWEVYDRSRRKWTFEHHSLPKWFLTDEGVVTPKRFIKIWQKAKSFSDVKREIFWWSVEEIQEFAANINQFLQAKEIEPLKEHLLSQKEWISQKDLDGLVEKSILQKEEYAQDSSEDYDPMKALLQAQKKRSPSNLSSIETMEVTGRYRFQARH